MNKQSLVLVLFCTVFTSVGQIFLKIGSGSLGFPQILSNWELFVGLMLYGAGALLLLLALKKAPLSVAYPLVSLGFVWVSLLSSWFLSDSLNMIQWAGIVVIVIGVAAVTK